MNTDLVAVKLLPASCAEDPPEVQDVLNLLHDLDQAHRGGLVERGEFQARKKLLLARIRGRS